MLCPFSFLSLQRVQIKLSTPEPSIDLHYGSCWLLYICIQKLERKFHHQSSTKTNFFEEMTNRVSLFVNMHILYYIVIQSVKLCLWLWESVRVMCVIQYSWKLESGNQIIVSRWDNTDHEWDCEHYFSTINLTAFLCFSIYAVILYSLLSKKDMDMCACVTGSEVESINNSEWDWEH